MALDIPPAGRGTEPRRSIAGYRLTRPLRRQPSDGVAYEATKHGARVALKLVDPGDDPGFAERFIADAERLRALDHEHVPEIRAVGREREGLYLVTALIEGATLDELIAEGGGLSPERAVHLLGEVADALDAAHAAGLLHRAVRPVNVVVEERPLESAYLVDFALGRSPSEAPADHEAATYASPEEIDGELAQPPSDVYSFACLAFETLTGAPPFLGDTAATVRDAHLGEDPPRASEVRPDLPSAMDAPLVRGLSKRPAERPATTTELMTDVSRALLERGPDVVGAPPEGREAGAWSAPPPMRAPAMGQGMEGVPAARSDPAGPWAAPPAPAVPDAGPLDALRRAGPLRLPRPTLPPVPARAVSPRLSIGVAAALVAVALIAGYVIGRPGGDGKAVASSQAVELTVPAGWSRAVAPSRIGRLELADRVAIAPRGGRSALVVGIARGASVVFPGRVVERVARRAPSPQSVRLGDFQAYRFADLRGGGRSMTLFAAPTSAGVLTAACYGPDGEAPRILPPCERAAGSLAAADAQPTSLAEVGAYGSRLERTLRALNRRRAAGRVDLLGARTPSAQARAGARLASIHLAAARSLEGGSPPSEAVDRANASVVSALVRVAVAYRRLGRAARRGDRRGYRSARRLVVRRERALRRTLRSP